VLSNQAMGVSSLGLSTGGCGIFRPKRGAICIAKTLRVFHDTNLSKATSAPCSCDTECGHLIKLELQSHFQVLDANCLALRISMYNFEACILQAKTTIGDFLSQCRIH
jgi:hypothetical protein